MAVDSYMNLQLENTEEYINDEFAGNLGQVLIRCNNVLYLRAVDRMIQQIKIMRNRNLQTRNLSRLHLYDSSSHHRVVF